jgi:hypothetical protein
MRLKILEQSAQFGEYLPGAVAAVGEFEQGHPPATTAAATFFATSMSEW